MHNESLLKVIFGLDSGKKKKSAIQSTMPNFDRSGKKYAGLDHKSKVSAMAADMRADTKKRAEKRRAKSEEQKKRRANKSYEPSENKAEW